MFVAESEIRSENDGAERIQDFVTSSAAIDGSNRKAAQLDEQ